MSEELIHVNDDQAREVGLPSPAALQYMMSVANMLLTSNLLGPDLEPSKEQIATLVAAKWELKDIDTYRDKVIKSNAFAKMLIGREMGIEAISALQDITIVKGRMFVHYSALIRQMQMKGFTCTWIERSNERAALKVAKDGDEMTFEFTIQDANQAGLLSSPPGKEQYNQYRLRPRVMLTARVASEAYRTTGGRANVYTPEEKQEVMRSTMDEPDESDAAREAVLQQKYHVGLKTDAPPAPAAPPAPPQDAAPPQPAKVVEIPKQDAAPPAPKPEKKAKETTKPNGAPPQPASKFVIYYLDREGQTNRMTSEEPQGLKEAATLRAQALSNETSGTYYVYEEIDGVRVAGPPVFTAAKLAAPPQPVQAPPAPAPAATPVLSTGTSLKDRLIEITRKVGEVVNNGLASDKVIPEKTVAARVKTFFLGYFGVGKLADLPANEPQNAELYENAFSDLEACARQDANVLLSAPEDAGKRTAGNTVRIGGMLNGELKWHPDNVALAFRFARLRNMEPQDLMTFFDNAGLVKRLDGGAWKSAAVDDITAALRLCLITRNAGRFIRECNAHNMSIAESLKWMEERKLWQKRAEECSAADVEKAIDWAMTAIKEKAAEAAKKDAPPNPPRRAPEPMPQEAPVAEEDDNLFTELPG